MKEGVKDMSSELGKKWMREWENERRIFDFILYKQIDITNYAPNHALTTP